VVVSYQLGGSELAVVKRIVCPALMISECQRQISSRGLELWSPPNNTLEESPEHSGAQSTRMGLTSLRPTLAADLQNPFRCLEPVHSPPSSVIISGRFLSSSRGQPCLCSVHWRCTIVMVVTVRGTGTRWWSWFAKS